MNCKQYFDQSDNPNRIMRIPEILEVTGLSRSNIYEMASRGEFPKPFKLGGKNARASGVLAADVYAWIEQCRGVL